MVPCQPKQLVILSLPLAALVAFLWFRRRKSLSRSDPGGTLARHLPVDNSSASHNNTVACQSSPVAEKLVKKEEAVQVASKPEGIEEPISAETVKTTESAPFDKIICNGFAVHSKDSSGAEKEESPILENGGIFHSTVIEEVDCQTVEEHCSSDEDPSEETEASSVDELEATTCSEQSDAEDPVVKTEKDNESVDSQTVIPYEEQSTVENVALNQSFIRDYTQVKLSDSSEVTNREEVIDLTKDSSSTQSDAVDKLDNISADTGLGSQDLNGTEDSSMAQGHNTEQEEKETGLEHKLASLGLDTQQQVQRDSANHSPAEVMLNSPAISTFSDAHSEGSSDSGKGCSDVVTPPSVTPAGGSSVAGDQVPSVYEFVLPQVIVGRLIGRHGAFLHDIRSKTHTNVFIKRHPETSSLKICAIEGTQPDIDAALKMIRQKFPLRRFPELTLERVTFVKNSSVALSPENMQLHLVEGVNNDVIISSLITAGHLFLQLPMHMSYNSLYRLACIMNSVYTTQESPPIVDPRPDVVCVAPAQGGWYRAQIISVDEESNSSLVRFMDYGGYLTVDNSLLRQIRADFMMLPFQAVECLLANIVPAGGTEEWSEEAKEFVQMMTTSQTLQAQLYEYHPDSGLPLIYLYCTQFYQSPTDPVGIETKVVLLNQELVSRGYAELIEPWQEGQQTADVS